MGNRAARGLRGEVPCQSLANACAQPSRKYVETYWHIPFFEPAGVELTYVGRFVAALVAFGPFDEAFAAAACCLACLSANFFAFSALSLSFSAAKKNDVVSQFH